MGASDSHTPKLPYSHTQERALDESWLTGNCPAIHGGVWMSAHTPEHASARFAVSGKHAEGKLGLGAARLSWG